MTSDSFNIVNRYNVVQTSELQGRPIPPEYSFWILVFAILIEKRKAKSEKHYKTPEIKHLEKIVVQKCTFDLCFIVLSVLSLQFCRYIICAGHFPMKKGLFP
jgi:hypothetical protein